MFPPLYPVGTLVDTVHGPGRVAHAWPPPSDGRPPRFWRLGIELVQGGLLIVDELAVVGARP